MTTTYAATFPCEDVFPSSLQLPIVEQCSLAHIHGVQSKNAVGQVNFDNQLFEQATYKNNLGGAKIHLGKNDYKKMGL